MNLVVSHHHAICEKPNSSADCNDFSGGEERERQEQEMYSYGGA